MMEVASADLSADPHANAAIRLLPVQLKIKAADDVNNFDKMTSKMRTGSTEVAGRVCAAADGRCWHRSCCQASCQAQPDDKGFSPTPPPNHPLIHSPIH